MEQRDARSAARKKRLIFSDDTDSDEEQACMLQTAGTKMYQTGFSYKPA
jgi:hypothetical protein